MDLLPDINSFSSVGSAGPIEPVSEIDQEMHQTIQQVSSAVQEFLTKRLSSGYHVVDIILGCFVFICLMQLTNKTQQTDVVTLTTNFFKWIYNKIFSNSNCGEIEFFVEQVSQAANCFTPTYRAIMHKLGTIENNQVWRFKEKRLEWYDNSEGKNMKESLYQVLQTEPIKVQENVWVRCEEKTEDRANTSGNQIMSVVTYKILVYSTTVTVHQLKKVVDQWLKEYKDFKKNQLSDKQLIFMVRFPDALSSWSKDKNDNGDSGNAEDIQFSTFKTFRSFDNLFFEEKEEVLSDINFFLDEKEWHRKRGLPDSLGILCYGVPGCGKTSFIKALLKKTNRHGVIFSVNRSTKLESIEKLMRSETLCDFPIPQNQRVYILEDIDAMGDLVTKRETAAEEEEKEAEDEEAIKTREKKEEMFERQLFKWLKFGLTKSSDHHLGFFLNLLDGLVETPGRILVMTTNHIENLDPALIRPGRIDINIEFVKCTRKVIKEIISHFYNKNENDWELNEEIVLPNLISGAEITQICRAHKFDFEAALEGLNLWMQEKVASMQKETPELSQIESQDESQIESLIDETENQESETQGSEHGMQRETDANEEPNLEHNLRERNTLLSDSSPEEDNEIAEEVEEITPTATSSLIAKFSPGESATTDQDDVVLAADDLSE